MANRLSREDWNLLVFGGLSAGRPRRRAAPQGQTQRDQFGLTCGTSVPIVYVNQGSGLQIRPDAVLKASLRACCRLSTQLLDRPLGKWRRYLPLWPDVC